MSIDSERLSWISQISFSCISESSEFTFNTLENPVRDAAYVRVICHEVDVPAEPDEIFRITVENGYFEIDGKEYTGTVEVPAGAFELEVLSIEKDSN